MKLLRSFNPLLKQKNSLSFLSFQNLAQSFTTPFTLLSSSSCSFATSRSSNTHAAVMQTQFSKKYHEAMTAVEEYAGRKQTPISVKHFLDFSRNREDPNTGVQSCEFIFCQELPTRIAHIVKLIDNLPFRLQNVEPVQKCKEWYLQTMHDIIEFQKIYKNHTASTNGDPKVLMAQSLSLCNKILHRHQAVVTTMAQGILDVKKHLSTGNVEKRQVEEELKGYERFLDRLYMSRIGTRMLQSQHIELFSIQHDTQSTRKTVGVFDEQLDVRALIDEAASNSNFLVHQKYADAPDWEIILYDRKKKKLSAGPTKPTKEAVTFAYVPSHLYHIVFELLKNSMRAVVEYHKESEKLPPVRIIAVKGDNDLTIKIEDQGGGVPMSLVEKLFSYSYSTADPPDVSNPSDMNHAPLAGFGYGLPMSRLYARYFGGDLKLVSTEGYGMDALIYLKVLAHDAKETLTELEALIDYETLPYEQLLEKCRELRRENQRLNTKIDKITDIMSA